MKAVKTLLTVVVILAAAYALYISSLYNYLLFHNIVEIFSVCIAVTVFVLTWNSARFIKNNYLLMVGTAYLFIGVLDFFHTISYKGMTIFKDYDYYANQLWIAARYFESIVLLLSFVLIKKTVKINVRWLSLLYGAITGAILLSVFVWKVFPVCFVDGVGQTAFKIISEYIICVILAAAILLLTRNKTVFVPKVYKYIVISLVSTIASELCFTTYISNYGFTNLLGHYFKIVSFYFIYRSIIKTGIRDPYDLIFREVKLNEAQLQDQNHQLANLAIIDNLTGIYNRGYVLDIMEALMAAYSYSRRPFVMMLIDIDRFKNINDTYGHITGDEVLKAVAGCIVKNTRKQDTAGRFGGDEFIVVLPETQLNDGGIQVAEKIRAFIQEQVFYNVAITVSIGLKEYNGEKLVALLEEADANLYKAKAQGRNAISV